MRQPSPAKALYAWHADAMAGDAPPIHDGIPECGWFKARLVSGGPWVPVEIKVERDVCHDTGELLGPERLICNCDGMRRDPARIWTYLTPISRDEHRSLSGRKQSIPAMAATNVKLDLSKESILP